MTGLATSKRWEVLTSHEDLEHQFEVELGVPALAARVMAARGIQSIEEAKFFLHPSLERDWADPQLIPGLMAAADRLEQAILRAETIAVFGDFDVDGMTSTCLLTLALGELGASVVRPYIPHRFGEGYGLSQDALTRVMEDGTPDLIVTVDNGIASAEEVRWLLEHHVDVVVTDHHEPADLVPTGVPVADPKLVAEGPSHDLAGAGVALKLVCELGKRLGKPNLWRDYTEIAALGTISDMMPLTRENRALVADGIERLRTTTRPGLVALAAVAGVDLAEITADSLPFSLVPRLNAAGRMGTTDVALHLLLASDPAVAAELAGALEQTNRERREIESQLAEEAMAKVEATFSPDERVIVVAGEGWHEGVKGIVASRIVNKYHVPTILFTISDGVARGSGRSVGSVDLFHAVEQCSDLCVRFGGHAGAVGVTVEASQLDAFRLRLMEVLAHLPEEQFIARGEIACVVGLEELTVSSIASLDLLQPFGQGNKRPLLAVSGVCMRGRSRVGRTGEHLRFVASDGIHSVPAIMFRAPEIERASECDEAVDLVFEPTNETWQGRTKPKLMVRDIVYRAYPKNPQPASDLVNKLFAAADASLVAGVLPDETRYNASKAPVESTLMLADDLDKEICHALLGGASPLPAQQRALELLGQNHSCLCVMATGRGKSYVFHHHATRLALKEHKASVFVYPLRALVADQGYHLAHTLASLGVGVALLTGETPTDAREQIFADLAASSVDVVLTTPEFLTIHMNRFAQTGRIGFVVIDEAHHAAASGSREAYAQLPSTLAALKHPTVLAVTATAATETANEICRLLSIESEHVVVDNTCRENLEIEDARELRDREAALVSLVASGERCLTYVNSRDQAVLLARMLRRAIPNLSDSIGFYHAGLSREARLRIEDAFRADDLSCVVATSAFGEGVNIPDVRHVVLYHMPFGSIDFNQMSGRAGRDGAPACIHVFFGSRDARTNERLLASSAPLRESLVGLWRTLLVLARRESDQTQTVSSFAMANADIAEAARETGIAQSLDEGAVSAGIAIFKELGLLSTTGYGMSRVVHVPLNPSHVELERSIRYREGIHAREEFHAFRDWVLSASAHELLDRIDKPIVPTFGILV